jgi:Domain of unknown function (DUF4157)
MSDRLNTTTNKRQNSDSKFKVSPLQLRGFGVQVKSEESVPATKAQLWESYQQAKQLNQIGAIQAKLTIGQPGDKYEQEADSVADHVMAMSEPTQVQREELPEEEEELQMKPLAETISPLVQREKLPEEEEELQMKSEDNVVQREELPEEEELQMKSVDHSIQREELSGEEELQMKQSYPNAQTATPDLESQLSSSKGSGSPLSDDVRSFMEPRFGVDFSQVKIHTDSQAVQMARDVGAQAFAHGQDIYFGTGKSPGNNELTAHELTHVVQQTGSVKRKSTDEKIQTKPLATEITLLGQRDAMSGILLQLKTTIKEAVDNFKTTVTPSNESPEAPTLVESGQFYWTNQIQSAIQQYISQLRFIPAAPEWLALVEQCETISTKVFGGDAKDIQAIRTTIASIRKRASQGGLTEATLLPLLLFVEPLLKPAQKSGKDLYYELWHHLQKDDKVPNLEPYRSIPILQAIWHWENQACGFTGNLVANRYTQKQGAKNVNPDAKRRKSTGIWASFSSSAQRDMRTNNDFRRGDVLIQSGVSGAISKMQAALDDGWILHARVLSGIDYGHGDATAAYIRQEAKGKAPKQPQHLGSPPQEHSIMIIGYENNQFVFWDPDSGSSNRHGSGFGALFFADGKFSTAENDADMVVNLSGNHHNGNHRYQIITVGSQ